MPFSSGSLVQKSFINARFAIRPSCSAKLSFTISFTRPPRSSIPSIPRSSPPSTAKRTAPIISRMNPVLLPNTSLTYGRSSSASNPSSSAYLARYSSSLIIPFARSSEVDALLTIASLPSKISSSSVSSFSK